jgi:hypothetical protein
MAKRPSLFSTPASDTADRRIGAPPPPTTELTESPTTSRRAPSREGKRTLSIYLDPLAWKQLRQLALDKGTTTQALGEEAVNLLFTKHGLNRSA